jgi:pyruvate kinase
VLKAAEELLLARGIVNKGDLIVMTWGAPMGQVGGTNALKIVKVGESMIRTTLAGAQISLS